MHRHVPLILFAIVLAAPFVLRAWVKTDDKPPAAIHGQVRTLVVITPHNQDIRREFARAFAAWHAAKFGETVEIDFRTPGGTNDIRRQLEDTYRSWRLKDNSLDPQFVPDIHVVWGGGPFFFDVELKGMKPVGVLQPMRIDPAKLTAAFPNPALAGYPLYETSTDSAGVKTPKWIGVCLSAFGIVYNPDVLRGLGVPEPATWSDLTHPRLVGQLALADPAHSGSASTAYMIVIERRMADAEEALFQREPDLAKLPKADLAKNATYQAAIAAGWKMGMRELLLIAANARYFADNAVQVPNDVGNGDAAAGISIDFYGRVYQDMVGTDRCRVVLPVGSTAINPDPVAILDAVKGPDLELATRFVEFLITPEAQRIWIVRPGQPGGPVERALRRPPARADLYADRTGWSDDINPFTQAHGFNQRPDFETLFSDVRTVWTAAWVDSREPLKAAYNAVLRLPEGPRRDALLVELSDLPITMQDVAADRTERKRREEAHDDAEEWKARNRIAMVKKFRSHFERISQAAR